MTHEDSHPTQRAQRMITWAVPKGRILDELLPILECAGITPEPAFFDSSSRQLQFATNHAQIRLIRVRSFDVATFVAFGAAQLGVVGSDVLQEFDYPQLYSPVDLNIGRCRLSVAVKQTDDRGNDIRQWSHVRVATKYPHLTTQYVARHGVQAECIKLNGAMELAPSLGLCSRIVDLVSTGSTLQANGLKEVATIMEVTSKLVVNRTALKTERDVLIPLIQRIEEAYRGYPSAE